MNAFSITRWRARKANLITATGQLSLHPITLTDIIITNNKHTRLGIPITKELWYNKLMNTLDNGQFSILIAGNKTDYVALCPEFAIVKYADSFEEARQDVMGAAKAYLSAIAENNLPHELLNRYEELPKDLQLLYTAVTERIEKKNTSSTTFKKLPRKFQTALNTGNAFLSPVCA